MKIACLAWGSLLWKPGAISIATPWQEDGPMLPLEFCRVADGGELSTALCEGASVQTSWWAELETGSLDEAREQLRQREKIDTHHPQWIGSLPSDHRHPVADVVGQWMQGRPLDSVVWTALPARHEGVEGRVPDAAEAVAYLDSLRGEERAHAEDYIRSLPPRFATATRALVEKRLGWTPR